VGVHDVVIALGYTGAALGVAMVVPQIVRIVRHPSLPGVSPLSWALSTFGCLAWLTYGLRTGAAPQIPGNILLTGGAVACVLLINSPMQRGRRGVLLLLGASVLLATVWVIPAQSVGYLATVIGLSSMWPQLFDTVGNWRAHITSGVSLPTYWLRVASQICWLSYGIGTHDVPVAVGASLALVIVTTTLALEALARFGRPSYSRLATAEA
jgi:uncharacterized protein with PQ loop repeat